MIYNEFKTQQFKEKATAIHNGRFTYDRAIYTGARSKLTVTCLVHGDFEVTADSHISMKSGCAKCHFEKLGKRNSCKPEDFVPKAIVVHGDRYDYSKAIYVLSKNKMEIICKEHGSFFMDANCHLSGQGCRKCAKHGYQIGKPGNFYVLRNENGLTKVGITNRVVQERVKKINRNTDLNFKQVLALPFENGSDALDIETLVLAVLRSQYKNPEQTYDGSTESFVNVDLPKLLQTISAIMTEKQILPH